MPHYLLFVLSLVLAIVPASSALRSQVLSSFVFTRHGDRTPLYSTETSVLTPYGAQQMFRSGSGFRQRYLTTTFEGATESTAIRDISHYQLDVDQVSVLSVDNQYISASAQAFMQGLYPPLADSTNLNYTNILGISELANGTNVVAPLKGYQYQNVRTASAYDLRSVYINGAANCPAYTGRLIEYYNTSDFDFLYRSSLEFYRGLDDYLEDIFTPNDLGYFDAYYIYDWLQYEVLHNSSFRISDVNITKARILAANWVSAMFSNDTDTVKSIAGQSLGTQIMATFYNAIQNEGQTNKLTLWFGDFAPMVSFAALAGLTSEQNAAFYNVPPMGSSYVFELVSLLPENAPASTFPNSSDLYVRFFYQNGTNEYSRMTAYPLFGRSPSQTLISYAEFVHGLSQFSLSGVKEWCTTCGSYSIFCPAYIDNSILNDTNTGRKGLSPAVAGVIGALVTLAVAAILFGLLMAFAGIRVRKQGGKRKSDLAGFKGSQKLASDQDLVIPKAGTGAVVTDADAKTSHARVNSHELKQAKQEEAGQVGLTIPHRRPSYEDDDIHFDPHRPAVQPQDRV